MRKPCALFALVIAALAVSPRAEILDQQKIHSLYADGEFEKLIAEIDGFTHRNKTYSHGDSAFISKYLAVVYAANPATTEKAKYYMYQLLKLQPEAQLMGMYANEEIEKLFQRMKTEYHATYDGSQGAPPPKPAAAPPPVPVKPVAPAPAPVAAPAATPAPATPRAAPPRPEAATPPARRVHFAGIASMAVPLGDFASEDSGAGLALTGFGLGGEFLLRVLPDLYWASSLELILNPFDVDKLEQVLADSLSGQWVATGGDYINLPVLTGVRYQHAPSRKFAFFGGFQVGLCINTLADLEVKPAFGGGSVKTVYTGSVTLPFALKAGVVLFRHLQLDMRFLDLRRARYKAKTSRYDASGGLLDQSTDTFTQREPLFTLSAGYQF